MNKELLKSIPGFVPAEDEGDDEETVQLMEEETKLRKECHHTQRRHRTIMVGLPSMPVAAALCMLKHQKKNHLRNN